MITALLLGVIKTAVSGMYTILHSLLSFVFTNYDTALASVTNSTPMKIAAGIIDIVCGWSFFVTWVGLALIVLPLIKLARYLIGLVTRG